MKKGGDFVITKPNLDSSSIFIPEDLTEDQKLVANSCEQFVKTEVETQLDDIDDQKEGLMTSLLEKAGELGLLSLSIPEEYGGSNLDTGSSLLATEKLGAGHSFSVAFAAHTGIGTMPILYYGNEEQKKKYIPSLASGETKGAYCLTEPSSGSDANSGKTKAVLSDDDKNYMINGQKIWITNGGFADILTVFAKIDDDKNLSAFIVESKTKGITKNPEEKKMGIKGSSTCQIFFENVKVPKENLLGKREEGFKIALNILNLGRLKLGAAVLGSSKLSLNKAIEYANQREQFGRPISKYGAIRHKIAEMATKIWVLESAMYRVGNDIGTKIQEEKAKGTTESLAKIKAYEDYASECSMMKVFGSEVLDYVVDESVQIFGGMGYSAESRVERAYRDSRINRIFEGTNEINRMVTVDIILKKGLKGELDLMTPAQNIIKELTSVPSVPSVPSGVSLPKEYNLIEQFKKILIMVAGQAVQKLMNTLAKEQEIIMLMSNILIEIYVCESAYLRTHKLYTNQKINDDSIQVKILKLYVYDACDKITKYAKDALNSFLNGDELKMSLLGVKRFVKQESVNIKQLRQDIALSMIEKNMYKI